jgi:hypothetical protein
MAIDYIGLQESINSMHERAHKAPIIKAAMQAAVEIERVHGVKIRGLCDLCAWIDRQIKLSQPPPAPPAPLSIRPPPPIKPIHQDIPREYLGFVLQEIYESGYDFADCDNPDQLRMFCNPLDDKWWKKHADLTTNQKSMFTVITIHYTQWMNLKGKSPKYLEKPVY